MKKLGLVLILSLWNFCFAQTVVKATVTEIYTYDRQKEEFELYQKNSDVDIMIILEDDFFTFIAQRPTMYRVYKSKGEELKLKKLSGVSYPARDLRKDEPATIHVMKFNSGGYMISIIPADLSYNLRYYVGETPNDSN